MRHPDERGQAYVARRVRCVPIQVNPGSFPRMWQLLAALLLVPFATVADTIGLPKGDVFRPLLADPKEPRFTMSVLAAESPALDTTIAAVAYGERFGLARWPGTTDADGWQVGLSGAVFAQFDLEAPSSDLVNSDFIIGIPLTYRRGAFSARTRVYHQSSHLGDEFLLRTQPIRVNLSYESLELLVSYELDRWRFYGGGETLFHREPEELESGIAHAGVEYRHLRPTFQVTRVGAAHFVSGLDVKSLEQHGWDSAISVKSGFEFHPVHEVAYQGRYCRLLAEYYDGPSPYGQFLTEDIRYAGFAVVFGY